MDLAISATPIANRCVKSSVQSCSSHRQTTDCTEKLSDFHYGTVKAYKLACYISTLVDLPQLTVSAVIVKWKHLGETTAQFSVKHRDEFHLVNLVVFVFILMDMKE